MFGLPSAEQKATRDRAADARQEFDALRQQDSQRLARYRDFELEYEGHREIDPILDLTDYGNAARQRATGEVRRHHIPLPYGHAITQKHAFRVAGRMPDLVCQRRDSTPPERFRADTIEKMLYASYGVSKAELQFASGAHDGSLHGASPFDIYWDAQREIPVFRACSPGSILLVPGVHDPHEFKRVYRFWRVSLASFQAEYKGVELPGGEDVSDIPEDKDNPGHVTIVQQVTDTHKLTFAGRTMLEEYQHDYGFCPYVCIPNLGPLRKVWGYSDYEFVRGLIIYYEAALSRQADVLRGSSGGAYYDDGSGNSTADVKRVIREGGVIGGRPEAKGPRPIEVAQQPTFTDTHLADIKTAIKDIGFAPDAIWGTLGAASGTDRALQIAPQVELTALKQIHWTAGLQRLNSMILRLIEQKSAGSRIRYRGTQTKGHVATPFSIVLNAASNELEDMVGPNGMPILDPSTGNSQPYRIPSNPRDLIDGDYETSVVWQRRLERDDPQFVLTQLNRFAQATQSLRTTLENLGVENPEDEMRLIEQEAERFPWLRQGMIALLKQQMDAMNQGEGTQTPGSPGGDIGSILQSITGAGGGASGALTADGMGAALNGNDAGGGSGPTSVPGAYGGAA